MKNIAQKIAVALAIPMLFYLIACGMLSGADDEDTAVIQTEISLDQLTAGTPQQPRQTATANSAAGLSLDEQQLMRINASLKNSIEENQKLIAEKKNIEKEIKELRGERQIRVNRVNVLTRQRDDLGKSIDELQKLQRKYLDELEELKKSLEQKEKEYDQKLSEMKQQRIQKEQQQREAMAEVLPRVTDPKAIAESKKQLTQLKQQARDTLQTVQKSANKATRQIRRLNEENKKLRKDSANMHYNLGNLFFEQRKYEKAAREYKKVIKIMPYDSSAHYNLAFVSGDFLEDFETALKHYKQYLYLEPDAEDVYFVREKMLEADLMLKTQIDSPIDPR